MDHLARNLASTRARIARACALVGRDPAAVRVVAVTKTQGPEVLAPLVAGGITASGENRVDHLEELLAHAPPGLEFHFIGRVQGRQLRRVVAACTCLHSLHDPAHVERLARACRESGRRIAVFCQVNTAGEAQKAGVAADGLANLLDRVRAEAEVLDLLGLMTMAPDRRLPGVDDQTVRRCFAATRELAAVHGLERLSMGMSGDFELAIAEGATDLRLGSVLFRRPLARIPHEPRREKP